MKNSNKIIICVFMLINSSLYAENTGNIEDIGNETLIWNDSNSNSNEPLKKSSSKSTNPKKNKGKKKKKKEKKNN